MRDPSLKITGPMGIESQGYQSSEIVGLVESMGAVGTKSGFNQDEIAEIRRLFMDEGRSPIQIAKILGKGSENSVRNALAKAKIKQSTQTKKNLDRFKPGQQYGKITLIKRLVKSKKLKYHVACACGYEFDIDPYLLTLSDQHKDKVSECSRCKLQK